MKGICWGIGNGHRVRAWLDNWINGDSLRGMIKGPLRQGDQGLTVADLYHDHEWRWDLLSFELPNSIKNKVKVVPIQLFGNRIDSIMWKYSKDGDFSTNSAYLLANEDSVTENQFQGQWLWKLDVLPKIISFLWLCVHGSVPVKSVLAGRGINCSKTYTLCSRHEETIIHLLRDCEVARDLWFRLGVPTSHINSFNENFETWLKINRLSTVRHNTCIPWSTLFVFAVGVCGRIGINWCLKTTFRIPGWIKTVLFKQGNIFSP
ncbi:putative ribonuclease h protein [Quercus suber]|uniref:Ribonuclease h protein n=1 Tax=Quercus suber TaxID=58331 RepID=A0AAW0IRM1_QUESU